ncbi:MAG: hypothetical protein ACD_77C00143G0013 [uncultured bacterium]|nr:MAG: hypothetical protein ACD_77C00143G0013 [uncultured bacterium]HBY01418.1 hypothetical protein [Rikenellaceae bacterium]
MKTKHLVFLAFFMAIIFGCNKSYNPSRSGYTKILQNSIDTAWQNYTAEIDGWKGGLGIYIVCPKGNFFVSSGLDPDATANSHFRGASITKSFTATAIMMLDQDGRLNIEDTISSMIPGTIIPYIPNDITYNIPYKNRITIRQLLEHRANIFDQVNSRIPDTVNTWYAGQIYYMSILLQKDRYHQFTLDELHGLISRHQLTYGPPGIEHHYSNNGYTLLATIIERVSGKEYHEFVKDEILDKNHLHQTTFPYLGKDTSLPAPFLHGYYFLDNTNTDFTMFNMSWGIAEGNIVSTFSDLATFYRNLFRGKAGLNTEQVTKMMECLPLNESYGLGIEFAEGLGYGHTGDHLGYLTVAYYDPEKDFMIVSESTFYPQDQALNNAQGRTVVNLLKKMKQILTY